MPKTTSIPNKRPITLTANRELVDKAKKMGFNISLILDAALEREVNPEAKEAFDRAIKFKNELMLSYLRKMKLEKQFEDFSYGDDENVVEEKTKKDDNRREIRERERSVGGIRF